MHSATSCVALCSYILHVVCPISTAGDDIKKLEDTYNQAQRHWIDNMINACRDYQRHEEERHNFLTGHWLKYIEICVAMDEASAEVRLVFTIIM